MSDLFLRHKEFKAFMTWFQGNRSDALVVCHDGVPAFVACTDDAGEVSFGWVNDVDRDCYFVDFS